MEVKESDRKWYCPFENHRFKGREANTQGESHQFTGVLLLCLILMLFMAVILLIMQILRVGGRCHLCSWLVALSEIKSPGRHLWTRKFSKYRIAELNSQQTHCVTREIHPCIFNYINFRREVGSSQSLCLCYWLSELWAFIGLSV
jgi:hypothetical protein